MLVKNSLLSNNFFLIACSGKSTADIRVRVGDLDNTITEPYEKEYEVEAMYIDSRYNSKYKHEI